MLRLEAQISFVTTVLSSPQSYATALSAVRIAPHALKQFPTLALSFQAIHRAAESNDSNQPRARRRDRRRASLHPQALAIGCEFFSLSPAAPRCRKPSRLCCDGRV